MIGLESSFTDPKLNLRGLLQVLDAHGVGARLIQWVVNVDKSEFTGQDSYDSESMNHHFLHVSCKENTLRGMLS